YLCDFRAARGHPDQIVIVGGMQQAMLITATALLNPGDPAWIEDPCYQQTRRVLTLAGARIVPRPLDDQGIVIARSRKEPLPKLIYVTPSHQFPLGVTMSFPLRTALLDLSPKAFSSVISNGCEKSIPIDEIFSSKSSISYWGIVLDCRFQKPA